MRRDEGLGVGVEENQLAVGKEKGKLKWEGRGATLESVSRVTRRRVFN